MPTPFVPLHVHSQFSLLEASSRVKDLVKVAAENGMPALALTDTANIYGAVDFYNACKGAGIKPIIGAEIAVIDGDITDKQTRRAPVQLVLLVKNLTGYQNLVKLLSIGHLKGFYYRPRINWELLEQHAEGLMVLTDYLYGPIGYHVLRGHKQQAREHLVWLKRVFGEDVYVEVQDHGIGTEMQISQEAFPLAKELGLDVVLTNDTRYTFPGQEGAVEILQCMQKGKTLAETEGQKRFNEQYYLKSGDEMATLLPHIDRAEVAQAMANTLKVAEKIEADWWPMGESILPHYPLPEGETEKSYLEKTVLDFARKKYGDPLPDEVLKRTEYELKIINDMGFPAYFLIVWDFMNWAREQGIPVGPGRGSAAGSLVAYVLGITNIDPIEHNLLFERFLNPERVSMPDIDIDFCIERRGEVIDYVAQRYGAEKVCQIATFGTLAAKAAVKAVARVMEIPFEESNRVSKMIPSTPGTKLKDALEEGQELALECEKNPQVKHWIDLALQLEGTACNVGTHAAGVVISKDPLDEVIALQPSKDSNMVNSQFTMGDLETLGLLKMDFLGLRNLTIIHNTLALIRKAGKLAPDMDALDLSDAKTYQLLTAGDTDGVFQLESGGMKALVKELKPNVFEDINALVALYRPGPLNSGMVTQFVNRKHGREKITFPHPKLEEILTPTYGTIVYQEQIMQIAQVLAGYSLGRADLLRRAMGKKKAEVMAKERDGFVEGCLANGVDEGLANSLFDTMSEFAAYCFNRSHSAAYAFVAFQTAYLKAHFPVEYLAALLSSVRDSLEKIQHYIVTAKRMGIQTLPPSISESLSDFAPSEDGQNIRFGLASIKGVGVGVVENIVKAREEAPFTNLEDFLKRVDTRVLNRKTMEALILAGALQEFGYPRRYLYNNLEQLFEFADRCANQRETGQGSLFDLMAGDEAGAMTGLMLSGNADEEYSEEEIQQFEKDLLGFYITSHPLDSVRETLPLVTTHTISGLPALKDGEQVRIGGLLNSIQHKISRKGRPLIIGQVEDFTGSHDFIVFGQAVELLKPVLIEGKKAVLKAKISYRDDSEQFSLIVNEAAPVEACQPFELHFESPPSYEEVAFIAKTLRENAGDLPTILRFGEHAERVKAGAQFWVNPQRLDLVKSHLQRVLAG